MDLAEEKWDKIAKILADCGVPDEVLFNEVMPLMKEASLDTLKGFLNDFLKYMENEGGKEA